MFYTLVQRFRGGSGLPGMDQVFLISRSKHGDIAGSDPNKSNKSNLAFRFDLI
jgi:hypothetical protein